QIQTEAIRLGHPDVEHLQRVFADELGIAHRVEVSELRYRRAVVERVGRDRHANRVETEALDLSELILPLHGPEKRRLQCMAAHSEVADAADLHRLAVRRMDATVLYVVTRGERGRGHCREAEREQQHAGAESASLRETRRTSGCVADAHTKGSV